MWNNIAGIATIEDKDNNSSNHYFLSKKVLFRLGLYDNRLYKGMTETQISSIELSSINYNYCLYVKRSPQGLTGVQGTRSEGRKGDRIASRSTYVQRLSAGGLLLRLPAPYILRSYIPWFTEP
jgi:hypothetical protein